jgi:hypothetical protein
LISVAQAGVLVRSYKQGSFSGLVGSFFGPTLYNEKNVYKAARTAQALSAAFPAITELRFKNPVLQAFSTAVWHCSSPTSVAVTLNEIAEGAANSGAGSVAAEFLTTVLAQYGEGISENPGVFCDEKLLPFSKSVIKAALKFGWELAGTDELRDWIDRMDALVHVSAWYRRQTAGKKRASNGCRG